MFTDLIGKRSFLSDCSAMAMDRWGVLSAFQPAKNKNGMAFVASDCDFNGRLGSNLVVISKKLPCFLLDCLPKNCKKCLFWAEDGRTECSSTCCFQNSSQIDRRSLGC